MRQFRSISSFIFIIIKLSIIIDRQRREKKMITKHGQIKIWHNAFTTVRIKRHLFCFVYLLLSVAFEYTNRIHWAFQNAKNADDYIKRRWWLNGLLLILIFLCMCSLPAGAVELWAWFSHIDRSNKAIDKWICFLFSCRSEQYGREQYGMRTKGRPIVIRNVCVLKSRPFISTSIRLMLRRFISNVTVNNTKKEEKNIKNDQFFHSWIW